MVFARRPEDMLKDKKIQFSHEIQIRTPIEIKNNSNKYLLCGDLQGPARADEARQRHGARAAGQDPERHLHLAHDVRAEDPEAHVEVQAELAPAAADPQPGAGPVDLDARRRGGFTLARDELIAVGVDREPVADQQCEHLGVVAEL